LDLSRNVLGRVGAETLADFIEKSSALVWLSLENTRLDDASFIRLCEALAVEEMDPISGLLTHQCQVEYLNLSRNYIRDSGMAALGIYLQKSKCLRSLDLSWNLIKSQGIITGLSPSLAHAPLESLDLSWNAITSFDGSVGEAIGEGMGHNKGLTHLDLSYNIMTASDCTALGNHLRSNHHLLGLHMSGNNCDTDSYGFITGAPARSTTVTTNNPTINFSETNNIAGSGPVITVSSRDNGSLYPGHIFTRILSPEFPSFQEMWEARGRCWICERWIEERFVFHPNDFYVVGDDGLEHSLESREIKQVRLETAVPCAIEIATQLLMVES